MTRLRVKLFATLAQCRPDVPAGSSFAFELPAGASVSDLTQRLGLPPGAIKIVFVNGRARPLDWPLQPDDEVGIFPPIGGG